MDLRALWPRWSASVTRFDDPDLTGGLRDGLDGALRRAGAPVVVRPGAPRRSPRSCARAPRRARPSCPRAATPGWSAGACPRGGEVLAVAGAAEPTSASATTRSARSPSAPARRSAALRDAVPDPGWTSARATARPIGGIVACDAGGARALRHGTARAPGRRGRGGAGRRLRRLPAERRCSRTTPATTCRAARRLRGDARRHHRRALADGPAAAQARRRADRGRGPRGDAPAALRTPSLEACDFFTAHVRARRAGRAERARRVGRRPRPAGGGRRGARRPRGARSPTTPRRARACGRCARASRSASARRASPHKLDVGVPLARLAEFLARVPDVAGDATAYLFGHLGDGNVHVNLVGDAPDEDASCSSSSTSAGPSPPSTASASPRPPGSSAPAAAPRSPPCARSRPPWTRRASSTPAFCCPWRIRHPGDVKGAEGQTAAGGWSDMGHRRRRRF